MSIMDSIIGLVAPHNCLGCGTEGRLLCSKCRLYLKPLHPACFRCSAPTMNYQTCPTCFEATGLQSAYRAALYNGPAKQLIWHLKFNGSQAAAREIAQQLTELYEATKDISIVPLPTATSRVRQRGYDQAVLLAKAYAKTTGAAYLPCLARTGQQHQRGASRQQRLRQLQKAYRLKYGYSVAGNRVILVDDVITTGASLQAAAQTLLAAGATQVDAIVFAQA